jgi:hypothetical protein
MQRSSETISQIACAPARAHAELANPEKALTATIASPFSREETNCFPGTTGINGRRTFGDRGVQDRPSACEDARQSPSRATRSTRTCCAGWRSRGRTRCGPWTSRTFRWRTASSISPWCWTGRHVVLCRGGGRSRWRPPSASRPWKMPWLATANRTSSTPIRALSSPARRSPACSPAMASPSAWTAKGAWRDNVFVERLWRSVKYEEVYLRAYETVGEARHSIGRYLDFYNGRRPHSSLDDMTPDQAYFDLPPLRAAA